MDILAKAGLGGILIAVILLFARGRQYVISGLLVGTILALFVVPVLHTYTDDLAQLVRHGIGTLTRRNTQQKLHERS